MTRNDVIAVDKNISLQLHLLVPNLPDSELKLCAIIFSFCDVTLCSKSSLHVTTSTLRIIFRCTRVCVGGCVCVYVCTTYHSRVLICLFLKL